MDDTLFERSSRKKMELEAKVFDHTDTNYKEGYRMLTLSWNDGNALILVNSCLLAFAKESNVIGQIRNFVKRIIAGKRRTFAQSKVPEQSSHFLTRQSPA